MEGEPSQPAKHTAKANKCFSLEEIIIFTFNFLSPPRRELLVIATTIAVDTEKRKNGSLVLSSFGRDLRSY
jgi:hypothetical protein